MLWVTGTSVSTEILGQEVLSALKMIKQVKQREGRVRDLVELRTTPPSQFWAEELTGKRPWGGLRLHSRKARKPVGPEGE